MILKGICQFKLILMLCWSEKLEDGSQETEDGSWKSVTQRARSFYAKVRKEMS